MAMAMVMTAGRQHSGMEKARQDRHTGSTKTLSSRSCKLRTLARKGQIGLAAPAHLFKLTCELPRQTIHHKHERVKKSLSSPHPTTQSVQVVRSVYKFASLSTVICLFTSKDAQYASKQSAPCPRVWRLTIQVLLACGASSQTKIRRLT